MDNMSWPEVRDVLNDLGQTVDLNDRKAVEEVLEQARNARHPDAQGGMPAGEIGKFPSPTTENLFHRIDSALTFVRNATETTFLPVPAQVPEIVAAALSAALEKLGAPSETRRPAVTDQTIFEAKEVRQHDVKLKLRPPRITLGAVSAALAGLLLLPKKTQDNMFLAPLASSAQARVGYYVALGVLLFSWIVVWFLQRRQAALLARAYSPRLHREALIRATARSRGLRVRSSDFEAYLSILVHQSSRADLTNEAWDRRVSEVSARMELQRHLVFAFRRPLDQDVLEEAAELALQNFLTKGLIRKLPPSHLESEYEVV